MVPKTDLDVALCFPVNIFLYQYNYIDNDYHFSLHKPLAYVPYLFFFSFHLTLFYSFSKKKNIYIYI